MRICGYVELDERPDRCVEIVMFGLLPDFVGRGLGKAFLSTAIDLAWVRKPERVWLHTGSLDHPVALPNYLARGFTIYQQETQVETVPDDDDPLWQTPHFRETQPEGETL